MTNGHDAADQVRKECAPMIAKAKTDGLLLKCHYQDILLSPRELEEKQSKGQFLWGPANWELATPELILSQLRTAAHRAEAEVLAFQKKYNV